MSVMSNVIFTAKYKIKENAEEQFLEIAKELKAIVKAEGLIKYDIFKMQNKNEYCEMFVFENAEAYENYDDSDEMLSLLLSKLSDLIVDGTIEYSTYENFLED